MKFHCDYFRVCGNKGVRSVYKYGYSYFLCSEHLKKYEEQEGEKTMTRKAITLSMSFMDLMEIIGEGNPGGTRVLADIIASLGMGPGSMLILNIDDMNIRGEQIWIGYKDHCGEDIDVFIQAIRDRSKDLVDAVNNGYGRSTPEIAVQRGGSQDRI